NPVCVSVAARILKLGHERSGPMLQVPFVVSTAPLAIVTDLPLKSSKQPSLMVCEPVMVHDGFPLQMVFVHSATLRVGTKVSATRTTPQAKVRRIVSSMLSSRVLSA